MSDADNRYRQAMFAQQPAMLDPRAIRQMQPQQPPVHPIQAARDNFANSMRAAGPSQPDTTGGKIAKFLGSAALPAMFGGLAGGGLGDSLLYGTGTAANNYAKHKELTRDIENQISAVDLGLPQMKQRYDIGQQTGRKLERDINAPYTSGTPSNWREWQMYSELSPDDQQKYLTMKRAQNIYDVGDERAGSAAHARGYGAESGKQDAIVENIPEKTRIEAESKATTEAVISLPEYTANAERLIGVMEQMINHPGLSAAVGVKGPTNWIPGTDAADFKALQKQISGATFLEAFEALKGGGQISEIEGQQAKDALNRLGDTDQKEETYRESLEEFIGYIRLGLQRKRARAAKDPAADSGVTVEWIE